MKTTLRDFIIPKGFAAFLDVSGKTCLGIKQFDKPSICKVVVFPICKPTRVELDAELAKRGIAQPAA